MHTRHNLLLVALTTTLLLLPTLTTADLICQSPTSLPTNTLQPGTPLTLKFTNEPTSLGSTLLSDVSANLICTSTGDSVLTLAVKLNSGKATSATLTLAQVASALKACPANSFHVQYKEDSLLSKTTENCQGSFSLQYATKQSQNPSAVNDPAILGPLPISVPLPIPEVPTTTGSPSTVPSTPTVVEPQPTTTGASVPPTTTTIPTITTTTDVPFILPSDHSSVTTPAAGTTTHKSHSPATTTTTTRSPKSGGGSGKGSGGGNDNGSDDNTTPPPSPTATPPNDLASSDMQQSSGSGPSTVTIAGISIGILAGVFVILGAMLVWRKRSLRRENLDLFLGSSLAAASGFQPSPDGTGTGAGVSSSAEQPIYGRSAPEEEKYEMNGAADLRREASSNAPRRSRSHTSNHNKSPMPASAPPPLMPMHPLPAAATGQDTSYYQQQQDSYYSNHQYHQQHQPQHQDYYASQHQHQQPPKRKPSYRLPRHHPAFDYDSEYEHQYGQR